MPVVLAAVMATYNGTRIILYVRPFCAHVFHRGCALLPALLLQILNLSRLEFRELNLPMIPAVSRGWLFRPISLHPYVLWRGCHSCWQAPPSTTGGGGVPANRCHLCQDACICRVVIEYKPQSTLYLLSVIAIIKGKGK
jgi:hypothetical protein